MTNPWTQLPDRAPYVLPCDRKAIKEYNSMVSDEKRIVTDLLPGPYVGNPLEASVIVLSLNPGFDEAAYHWHNDPSFSRDLRQNLVHCPIEYPFYYLNPSYRESGGSQYWRRFLREVIRAVGGDNPERLVANRVAVVEWYAYHSRAFSWREELGDTDSHRYSQMIVRRALSERNRIFVVHRAPRRWNNALDFSGNGICPIAPGFRMWNLKSSNVGEDAFTQVCEAIQRGID